MLREETGLRMCSVTTTPPTSVPSKNYGLLMNHLNRVFIIPMPSLNDKIRISFMAPVFFFVQVDYQLVFGPMRHHTIVILKTSCRMTTETHLGRPGMGLIFRERCSRSGAVFIFCRHLQRD